MGKRKSSSTGGDPAVPTKKPRSDPDPGTSRGKGAAAKLTFLATPEYFRQMLLNNHDAAHIKLMLYTEGEVEDALKELRKQRKFTKSLKFTDVPHQESTPEGIAFQNSKFAHTTPMGKSPPSCQELANVEYPGNLNLTAKQMSKLIAFLKINGGFKQVPTQALGNCLYAAILRGTDAPFEFTSTHLRRYIVMKMAENPDFWYEYLSYSIAATYGFDRDYSPEEIDQRERDGLMTPQAAHDARLPGSFTFVEFLNHINTEGTWGDDHILIIISCLWQVSITSLNCEKLTETRFRHNSRLNDVDLVVLFVGGDHFMGCVHLKIHRADGVTHMDTYSLACAQVQVSENFVLDQEDPEVYSKEDRMEYNPPRTWPNEPLPTEPEEETAPAINPQIIKKALSVHHMTVDWLKSIGVDACKDYANQSVELVLEAVVANDKRCSICQKKCYDTQRLRAHIRSAHMEKTPYYCEPCNKYFGDKATLTLHNRKHDTSCPLYECDVCEKTYTSQSRLKEHKKVYDPAHTDKPCRWCGKVIHEKKNLVDHEKFCEQNPNKLPRKQCPYCKGFC